MVGQSRGKARGVALAAALAVGAALVLQPGASTADVTAVTGSAYGASGSVRFGAQGTPKVFAPTPTVALPATGESRTGSADSILFTMPPPILETGPATVQTQGTLGPTGSVTSSATMDAVEFGGSTIARLSSTCQASEAGFTGSTTVTNGQVPDAEEVPQPVPTSPAANTTMRGAVPGVSDNYRAVFNEQIVTGNSITVNAVHFILEGPTAFGDVIVGQSVCGVTATNGTTTTLGTGTTTTTLGTGGTTTTTLGTGGTTTTTLGTGGTTTTRLPSVTTTIVPPFPSITSFITDLICGILRQMRTIPFLQPFIDPLLTAFGCTVVG